MIVLLTFFLVSILSVFAYQSDGSQTFELISHFRTQYLLVQLACLLVMLLFRSWRGSVLILCGLLLNLVPIAPYYIPKTDLDSITRNHIKVVQLNLLVTNRDYTKMLQFIAKEDPDIIGFEEVSPYWSAVLTKALSAYPYRIVEPEKTAFGIALFSKRPLKNGRIKYFGKAYQKNRFFPSIVADTVIGGESTTMIVTHPLPPMAGFEVRNSQLADMAAHRAEYHKNLIIIGDLNVTPWSSYFQRLVEQTGLSDSQLGFGVQPSWQSPIPLISIPIDHILTSDRFIVGHRALGPDIGSDHLPVVAQLHLK